MASRILVLLLPIASTVARVFLGRLVAEASSNSLPEKLRPYAVEVVDIANFLLPLVGGTEAVPTAAAVKTAG